MLVFLWRTRHAIILSLSSTSVLPQKVSNYCSVFYSNRTWHDNSCNSILFFLWLTFPTREDDVESCHQPTRKLPSDEGSTVRTAFNQPQTTAKQKGYSFTTSVSIRRLPGLGDDIFTRELKSQNAYKLYRPIQQQQIWRSRQLSLTSWSRDSLYHAHLKKIVILFEL